MKVRLQHIGFKVVALVICLISGYSSFSQTSWKGTTSTAWTTASNWSTGVVPTSTTDVIIGDANFTGSNQPSITTAVSIKSLTIGTGTKASNLTVSNTLTLSSNLTIGSNGTLTHGNYALTLSGNYSNSGTYTGSASSSVVFAGTAQTIGGTNATFKTLTINSSSTVTLNANVNADVAFNVNGVFDPNESPTYKISGNASFTVGATGTVMVKSSTVDLNYFLFGAVTLAAGSTVDYAATSTSQTVYPSFAYSTLKISGSGIKTLGGDLTALMSSSASVGNINVVSGTLDLSTYNASRGTTVAGGTLSVSNGATLKIGGTTSIPSNYATYTFGVTSTAEYTGTSAQVISPRTFGDLLLSGSGTFSVTGGTTVSVAGDLTISAGILSVSNGAGTSLINVSGDFTQSGGTVNVSNSTGTGDINITGNATISAGTFNVITNASAPSTTVDITGSLTISSTGSVNLETVSSSGTAIINVGGSFTATSTNVASSGRGGGIIDFGTGTITNNAINIAGSFTKSGTGTFGTTSATTSAKGFVFNGSSTQNFSYSGTSSQYVQYTINSGATLNLLTGLSLLGGTTPTSTFIVNGTLDLNTYAIDAATNPTFLVSSTGKIITDNTAGLSAGFTGTWASKTFTTGATYEFSSAVASQSFGFSGLTMNSPGGILISNTGGTVTSDANVTFTNSAFLTINSGAVLSTAHTYTFGTSGIVTVNGTLKTSNANGLSGGAATTIISTNSPAVTLGSSSTIEYNSASAQTITALNYSNLTSSSTGARTLAGSGTIGVSATFTPGTNTYTITGSTINFNGSSAQTIPAFNYNNLTSSSTGARTLASSGTIGIAGTFTPGTNAYTITGSTINFNSSSTQTILAFNYNNLTSSSTGARTLAGSGTIGVAGTFTPGTNTYTITGSTVNFNSSAGQTIPAFNYYNLTSSSTGTRTLASSGTIGVAGTLTGGTNTYTVTGSTVLFNGTSAQSVSAFTYNNVTINNASGITLSGDASVNGTLTFTSGKITTSTNKVILATATAISGAGSSTGWVVGNLQRYFSATTGGTFDIGSSSYYTPVSITFASVTTAGSIIASTTSTSHPSLSSYFSNKINRYWTLSLPGTGAIAFTSATITLNWNAADNFSPLTASLLKVAKYTTSVWSYPTVSGTPTSTSIVTTGITTLGDFTVGTLVDTDGDGIADINDIDDDNDGIPDVIEVCGSGATSFSCLTADPSADSDGDGIPNYKDANFGTLNTAGCVATLDSDSDGIPDYLDSDSDNDGIPDVVEAFGADSDGDGKIDNFTDTDSDGLSQNVDANNTGSSGSGNGLGFVDYDGDGVPNSTDLDSDNDGIPDIREALASDTNNDGRVDSFTDANGNGLHDSFEGAGALIITGTDTNSDGKPDSYPNKNADLTGYPNPYDLDSDGDGIVDVIEFYGANYGSASITNGKQNGTRVNGWSTTVSGSTSSSLVIPNTDGRGPADFLDIDSDDDGIGDNIEAQPTNSYKVPSDVDTDNDGIADVYEVSVGTYGAPGLTPYDHDADGMPDYLDSDADNDGAPDLTEASQLFTLTQSNINTTDTDGDGMVDQFDGNAITSLTTGNYYKNVTNSQMGANGSFGGPVPSGSNAKLVQSVASANRDFRNASILPLNIVSFSGNISNKVASLNWKVENELNVNYYIVERSNNGRQFDSIGMVKAANRNASAYSFSDDLANNTSSTVYYKIRQVNKNGENVLTQIIVLKRDKNLVTQVSLFPNPAHSSMNLNLQSEVKETADMKVIDAQGRTLLSKTFSVDKGINSVAIPEVKTLSKGLYLLIVNMHGQAFPTRFIIE